MTWSILSTSIEKPVNVLKARTGAAGQHCDCLQRQEDSDWSRWAERMTSAPSSRRVSTQDDIDAALDGSSRDAMPGRGAPTLQVLHDRPQKAA